jgi:uncharacterized membrane protein YdfJ with MMPL/SSD domain
VLDRLAVFIHGRRRVVGVCILAFVVLAFAIGGPVVTKLTSSGRDFEDPSAQSVKAREQLERATGANPDVALIALIRPGVAVASVAGRAKVQEVATRIAADPAVAQVYTTFNTHNPGFVSRDGQSTYVVAAFKPLSGQHEVDAAKRIGKTLKSESGVKLGGSVEANRETNTQVSKDLARAEQFGIPILIILSFIFFRGLVAALLPILVGVFSVGGTFLALRIVDQFTPLSIFAINLVTGLGIGLGIDYSLFILSRYREELAAGREGVEALRRTLTTAGRTVAFSALTVAVAMAALLVFPQRFLYSMGFGGLFVALLSAVSALVLLPTLIAFLGPRVNALSPAFLRRSAERSARTEQSGFWYQLSGLVMRHALPIAIAASALLILLGIPFLHIRFTGVDASVLPKSASARQVQDALATDFNQNETSPIYLAITAPRNDAAAVSDYVGRLHGLPNVLTVTRPAPVSATTWRVDVYSTQLALASQTKHLVKEIRNEPASFRVRAGGESATFLDQQSSMLGRLPLGLALIAVTTGFLLFLMTGSVILPVKTLILNVLSLSATLGFLVLVFQDGRLESVLRYSSQGALNLTQPILIGALAFALSTDYAVFLLTRIKEAHDSGLSNTDAVAIGMQRTGRIVTAAALMLAVAIGAFVTSKIVLIKELGLGVAFAVLLDATVVRGLLVPSLMKLLGEWNWWAPAPLRRLHNRIGLHEAPSPPALGSE